MAFHSAHSGKMRGNRVILQPLRLRNRYENRIQHSLKPIKPSSHEQINNGFEITRIFLENSSK